jgi:hypothetical protein
MGRSFTREELYDLVWTQPRTALAKKLGVSDVWIGKQCRAAHIPMPPPGHWAMAQSGQTRRRPPLPIRLPGYPSEVAIGESPSAARWGRPEDPNEPITAPVFNEDIDAQVAAALALVGKVTAKRDLSQPHSSLSRILAREAQRRAKFADRGWSLDAQLFDDAMHQRQLRILNSLSWALDRASAGGEVLDDPQWIQGLGTTHRLCLRLDFGGTSLVLRFLEPSSHARVIGEKPPATTTLRVGNGRGDLPTEQWFDRQGSRLEQQLPTIAEALLRKAEVALRHGAQRHYEWRLERRQARLRELERQRVEAERERLAEIEARRKKVRDGIIALAQDARVAQEIRLMVASLEQHPDLQRERPAAYDDWRNEALDLADQVDPMKRSLGELLGGPGCAG